MDLLDFQATAFWVCSCRAGLSRYGANGDSAIKNKRFLVTFLTWWLNPWSNIFPFNPKLGGGFKHYLCSHLPEEMIQFDQYFPDGLKPPTRKVDILKKAISMDRPWMIFWLVTIKIKEVQLSIPLNLWGLERENTLKFWGPSFSGPCPNSEPNPGKKAAAVASIRRNILM